MNARQYDWTLTNRRAYDARPLLSGPELARAVRTATRAAALHEAAVGAWQAVCPPDFEALAGVDSFREGRLVIAVEGATAAHELRQRAAGLRRVLTRWLPGLRAICIVPRSGVREAGDA